MTALLLLLAGSAGCDAGWGPPRDISRFDSAAIAEDGRLGVFTYKRRVYRPASRTLRPGGYREYLALSEPNAAGPVLDFTVSYRDGAWRLQWGRKVAGEWRYETLPLTVADVAAGR